MDVIQINDETKFGEVIDARRALVLLSVAWSGPERVARHSFGAAAQQLGDVGARLFVLDEDAEWCLSWLAGLGIHGPMGAGSVLWLEMGKVVDFELAGHSLSRTDIVSRTHAIWSPTFN
jgi:hypothetical protein